MTRKGFQMGLENLFTWEAKKQGNKQYINMGAKDKSEVLDTKLI